MKDIKITGRSKRMQHFLQLNGRAQLNLVALMDIFTILVFFLLVSSGAQNLPSNKDIKLPTTVSQKQPEETLIIAISKDDILVQGLKVTSVGEALASSEDVIAPLEKELKFLSNRTLLPRSDQPTTQAITVMGDESIPYKLLKKILTTCQKANFTQIAFAAYQVPKGKP